MYKKFLIPKTSFGIHYSYNKPGWRYMYCIGVTISRKELFLFIRISEFLIRIGRGV